MASDETVWQIINQQFCSFKIKTVTQNFCRNEWNLTGLCSRQACPLANSRYCTVRMDAKTGRMYLYQKTIERAHQPAKLWERIKLSANYQTALRQIDDRLQFWPGFLIHKSKQRLTRLVQTSIRMRRLAREETRLGEKLVPKLAPKIRRREDTRERKAEAAAKLERTIERELLERLRSGAYGDQPLNVSESIWMKVLGAMERNEEATRDEDMDTESLDENEDELEEELEEDDLQVEYVSDMEESDDDLNDIEDWLGSDDEAPTDDDSASEEETKRKPDRTDPAKRKAKKVAKRKAPKVEKEIEYEQPAQSQELAW